MPLPEDYEVVVVDNDSDDGRWAGFQQRYPSVVPVMNPGNPGFGDACNAGAAAGRAPQLLFLNPDTVAATTEIEKLRAAHTVGGTGISAPTLRDERGRLQRTHGPFPRLTTAFGWSRALRRLLALDNSTENSHRCRQVEWVTGAALMIDRGAFDRLGGFDRSYWMYYEDVDLCRRAHDLGIPVRYCACAEIVHAHGGASRRDQQTGLTTRTEVVVSRHLYIQKHCRGINRLLMHLFTVISRLLAPLPACLFSVVRRERAGALIAYYRAAYGARRWKTRPGAPEYSPR